MEQEEAHDFNRVIADVPFFGFVLDGVDVCGIKAVNWWDGDGNFFVFACWDVEFNVVESGDVECDDDSLVVVDRGWEGPRAVTGFRPRPFFQCG